MQININKLASSLKEVDWEYDFKITIHKDGSAHLAIPEFIMRDLEWAVEDGFGTPYSQVACRGWGSESLYY